MTLGFLTEDKLKSSERTDFGLPELKKYPMPDESHVKAAIRMFNHVDKAHEAELARNIKSKMKQYNISPDIVGEKNRLSKYVNESMSKDNKNKIGKKVTKAASHIGGSAAGAYAGGAIGTAIGGPAGAFLGSATGSYIGSKLGDKTGEKMTKRLF